MKTTNIEIPVDKISQFCRKWGIEELSIFGSALRDDFRPESDVDVLVSFLAGHGINFDNRVQMLDELGDILGREVDLVEKRRIKNPFRKKSILSSREIIYAAGLRIPYSANTTAVP